MCSWEDILDSYYLGHEKSQDGDYGVKGCAELMSNGREKGGPHLLCLNFNFLDLGNICADDNELRLIVYELGFHLYESLA